MSKRARILSLFGARRQRLNILGHILFLSGYCILPIISSIFNITPSIISSESIENTACSAGTSTIWSGILTLGIYLESILNVPASTLIMLFLYFIGFISYISLVKVIELICLNRTVARLSTFGLFCFSSVNILIYNLDIGMLIFSLFGILSYTIAQLMFTNKTSYAVYSSLLILIIGSLNNYFSYEWSLLTVLTLILILIIPAKLNYSRFVARTNLTAINILSAVIGLIILFTIATNYKTYPLVKSFCKNSFIAEHIKSNTQTPLILISQKIYNTSKAMLGSNQQIDIINLISSSDYRDYLSMYDYIGSILMILALFILFYRFNINNWTAQERVITHFLIIATWSVIIPLFINSPTSWSMLTFSSPIRLCIILWTLMSLFPQRIVSKKMLMLGFNKELL
jgi:hypothetical protein